MSCDFLAASSAAKFDRNGNFISGPNSCKIMSIMNGGHSDVLPKVLEINGEDLTIDQLVGCGVGHYKLKLSQDAERKVEKARNFVNRIIDENRVVYAVTTGVGNFASVKISTQQSDDLQLNIIRSHCVGVGQPLTPNRARMLLALRINVLAKGHSGVSLGVLQQMIDAFNSFCVSWIPEKGSVGCSGDLAPLAHLTLGLLGEGKMWSPETGWAAAKDVLESHGLTPVKLHAKEGITLINGTQLIVALGAEAVQRADLAAKQADVISAITLEALKGSSKCFDKIIHQTRPHTGQSKVAARLRALLTSQNSSSISESHIACQKVQDSYSLRCIPQVHGIVHDTIDFVKNIIATEINSATDNPLIFEDQELVLSNGNFHGEYPGKAMDYLAIGVSELAQISERRLERLLNKDLSGGLPPFLVESGGLNSGFMMIQVTAAALVSENKVFCHPSTVDSIPTSAGQEDHVAMATFAARKALSVLDNVEQVLAIELLCACQALDFLKPLTTTPILQKVYDLVRERVPFLDKDRYLSDDIETVVELLKEGQVWDVVKSHITEYENKDATKQCMETNGHHVNGTNGFSHQCV